MFPLLIGLAIASNSYANQTVDIPLFPEDGSLQARTWWISSDTQHELPPLGVLQTLLAPHGVSVRRAEFQYSYLQDVLLFDEKGRVLVQANMEGVRGSVMSTLTRGVFEDGEGTLTRFSEKDAEVEGLEHLNLRAALVEGGALISGRFADGTPYVLTDTGTRERGSAFLGISREESLSIISKDLRVSEENFIELTPWSGHLDLSVQPFPGGVVLLHDPSMKGAFLREALRDPLVSDKEKKELQDVLKLNEEDAADSYFKKILDKNADRLRSKGFQVIRVPGRFSRHSPGFTESFDRINFLNGTVGRGENGELFVLTNRSEDLPSLERLWAKKLSAALPILEKHIYFIGKYSFGAGTDCMGVISPNVQVRETGK